MDAASLLWDMEISRRWRVLTLDGNDSRHCVRAVLLAVLWVLVRLMFSDQCATQQSPTSQC